jgi:hypothetical protein
LGGKNVWENTIVNVSSYKSNSVSGSTTKTLIFTNLELAEIAVLCLGKMNCQKKYGAKNKLSIVIDILEEINVPSSKQAEVKIVAEKILPIISKIAKQHTKVDILSNNKLKAEESNSNLNEFKRFSTWLAKNESLSEKTRKKHNFLNTIQLNFETAKISVETKASQATINDFINKLSVRVKFNPLLGDIQAEKALTDVFSAVFGPTSEFSAKEKASALVPLSSQLFKAFDTGFASLWGASSTKSDEFYKNQILPLLANHKVMKELANSTSTLPHITWIKGNTELINDTLGKLKDLKTKSDEDNNVLPVPDRIIRPIAITAFNRLHDKKCYWQINPENFLIKKAWFVENYSSIWIKLLKGQNPWCGNKSDKSVSYLANFIAYVSTNTPLFATSDVYKKSNVIKQPADIIYWLNTSLTFYEMHNVLPSNTSANFTDHESVRFTPDNEKEPIDINKLVKPYTELRANTLILLVSQFVNNNNLKLETISALAEMALGLKLKVNITAQDTTYETNKSALEAVNIINQRLATKLSETVNKKSEEYLKAHLRQQLLLVQRGLLPNTSDASLNKLNDNEKENIAQALSLAPKSLLSLKDSIDEQFMLLNHIIPTADYQTSQNVINLFDAIKKYEESNKANTEGYLTKFYSLFITRTALSNKYLEDINLTNYSSKTMLCLFSWFQGKQGEFNKAKYVDKVMLTETHIKLISNQITKKRILG